MLWYSPSEVSEKVYLRSCKRQRWQSNSNYLVSQKLSPHSLYSLIMKLYATVQSERASKSQGGKNLDIIVLNEKREKIFEANLKSLKNGTEIYATTFTEEAQCIEDIADCEHNRKNYDRQGAFCKDCGIQLDEEKGERQKGEHCPHYINSDPRYNPDGWKWCSQCK